MSNRSKFLVNITHIGDVFSEKYSDRIIEKYLIYTKDLKKEADIIMMPVYMVPFLR